MRYSTLSPAQQADLESIIFFMPKCEITDEDVELFFEYSERGEKADTPGFWALVQGKKWRGVHMGMYEEGVLDGSMPYYVILDSLPPAVINFMKKEMFKGRDADLIDKVVESLELRNKSLTTKN